MSHMIGHGVWCGFGGGKAPVLSDGSCLSDSEGDLSSGACNQIVPVPPFISYAFCYGWRRDNACAGLILAMFLWGSLNYENVIKTNFDLEFQRKI